MNRPKKHHFLPQFYLNGFQISNLKSKIPKVYVLEKNNECRCFTSSVKDAGCKRNYHAIENSDKSSVEQELSRIEGVQAAIIKQIVETGSIEGVDVNSLSFFILLMRSRVPSTKTFVKGSLQKTLRSTLGILLKSGKVPTPPAEIQKILDEGMDPFKIEVFNERILYYMFSMAQDPRAMGLLSKMNFRLLRSPKEQYFITSDAPVAYYVPDYNSRRTYGAGLNDRELEITFPLTRDYLLLATWQERGRKEQVIHEQVKEYNRRTIISAQNYVYSNSRNNEIVNLVKKYYRNNSGFDFSSMESGRESLLFSRFIPVSS